MRVLLASIISGMVGLIQVIVIGIIESQQEEDAEKVIVSDVAGLCFALMLMVECVCVIGLGMYRYSPWILRLLREDPWEINRIVSARKRNARILQYVTMYSAVLRRAVIMADSQSFSTGLILSLFVALLPVVIPSVKLSPGLAQPPASS